MKTIIENYKRRLSAVTSMLENFKGDGKIDDIKKSERLNTKSSEYKTFIAELERETAKQEDNQRAGITMEDLEYELHKIFPEYPPVSSQFQMVEKLFRQYCQSIDTESQEVKQTNVSAEEMKYLATTFVHKCRLKGIVSSDDTSNLYDEFIKEYALHPHLIQEVKQDKLDAGEIKAELNQMIEDCCFEEGINTNRLLEKLVERFAPLSTDREPKQVEPDGWKSVIENYHHDFRGVQTWTAEQVFDWLKRKYSCPISLDLLSDAELHESVKNQSPQPKQVQDWNEVFNAWNRLKSQGKSKDKGIGISFENWLIENYSLPKQVLNVTDEHIKDLAHNSIDDLDGTLHPERCGGLYDGYINGYNAAIFDLTPPLLSPVAIEPETKK